MPTEIARLAQRAAQGSRLVGSDGLHCLILLYPKRRDAVYRSHHLAGIQNPPGTPGPARSLVFVVLILAFVVLIFVFGLILACFLVLLHLDGCPVTLGDKNRPLVGFAA